MLSETGHYSLPHTKLKEMTTNTAQDDKIDKLIEMMEEQSRQLNGQSRQLNEQSRQLNKLLSYSKDTSAKLSSVISFFKGCKQVPSNDDDVVVSEELQNKKTLIPSYS